MASTVVCLLALSEGGLCLLSGHEWVTNLWVPTLFWPLGLGWWIVAHLMGNSCFWVTSGVTILWMLSWSLGDWVRGHARAYVILQWSPKGTPRTPCPPGVTVSPALIMDTRFFPVSSHRLAF